MRSIIHSFVSSLPRRMYFLMHGRLNVKVQVLAHDCCPAEFQGQRSNFRQFGQFSTRAFFNNIAFHVFLSFWRRAFVSKLQATSADTKVGSEKSLAPVDCPLIYLNLEATCQCICSAGSNGANSKQANVAAAGNLGQHNMNTPQRSRATRR